MKKLFLLLCAVSLIFGVAGIAGATVLTFENLPHTDTYAPVPDAYGGFAWDNFVYVNENYINAKTGEPLGLTQK